MNTPAATMVFIGSSTEGHTWAVGVMQILQETHEGLPNLIVRYWKDTIVPGPSALEQLMTAADACDFGIFLLTKDDMRLMRKQEALVPRDNVVFELGLFTGKLGHDRTFVMTPDDADDLALPTDLIAITLARYKASDTNPTSAVRTATEQAIRRIREKGPRLPPRETETLVAGENPPDLWIEAANMGFLPELASTPREEWMDMWVWHIRYGVGRIFEVGPPHSPLGQWVSVEFPTGPSQLRITNLRAGRLAKPK